MPGSKLGDINSDMSGRRGRVLGMDSAGGDLQTVIAEVPLAEVTTYARSLSSMTGGQGSYTMEFSHYDVVPGNVQKEIIDKAVHEGGGRGVARRAPNLRLKLCATAGGPKTIAGLLILPGLTPTIGRRRGNSWPSPARALGCFERMMPDRKQHELVVAAAPVRCSRNGYTP